ncbi:MAG TPA: hypothetical protein VLF89_05540, partial [Candidatus Saccharimonadales bacterium]|nr:hypothetical protein [Candidatus Saccharimonadales bacterium]
MIKTRNIHTKYKRIFLWKNKIFVIFAVITILVGMICSVLVQESTNRIGHAAGNTYYVSKNGNNADGTSWTSAWNELNQINWTTIQPGDTIFIDGGTSGMTYTTTMTVGKSGTSGSPITIVRATQAS